MFRAVCGREMGMERGAANYLELRRQCDELAAALQPFTDLRYQKGAHGVISKKLDGFSPLTVTVTKAQMIAALDALKKTGEPVA